MRKGQAATDDIKAAAVAAVDDLLVGDLTRHQAFALVATNVGVHPHTVRNWWRAVHPDQPLTDADRTRLIEAELKVAALTRLNERLAALDPASSGR